MARADPLPSEWSSELTRDLFYIKGRIGWRGLKKADFTDAGPYLITGVDFTSRGIDWSKCVHIPLEKFQESPEIIARKNDILITKDGTIGKVALVNELPGPASLNSHLLLIRNLDDRVFQPFAFYVFQSDLFQRYVGLNEAGSTLKGLSQRVFEKFNFPLPSLPEQRKVAAILSSVDDAIEETQAVIDQVQAVKKGLMQKLLARGLPGRHTTFKKTKIGEIPEEWEVTTLNEVAEVHTGLAKNKKNAGSISVPYLRVANVQDGFLNLAEMKCVEVNEEALSRYALKPGDVLFTEGGDADKLGRGCVWEGQIQPCLHQNHVFAVRPVAAVLRPMFLSLYGGSSRGKAYFLDCAKQTTNLASINSTQLKALPVPIPPLEEQDKILERTTALQDREDRERGALAALRTVKSSLMSVLLTGEVRVKSDTEAT